MTRDELDNVVDFTRRFADELEIVPDRDGDGDGDGDRDGGTVDLVDAHDADGARDGVDALDGDRGDHPSISPEMIGLPTPTSDLLPRRRRFWLRTLPAVTEPHVEAATPDPDPPVDGAPGGRPDLSDFRLPGTRVARPTPPPRAPRAESPVDSPQRRSESPVESLYPRGESPVDSPIGRTARRGESPGESPQPAAKSPQPRGESPGESARGARGERLSSPPAADDAVPRPDRRTRRQTRHTRAVVVSSVALVLLALAVVISVLTLVVR